MTICKRALQVRRIEKQAPLIPPHDKGEDSVVELNECSKERSKVGSHKRQKFPRSHQLCCPNLKFGFCLKCNDKISEVVAW